MQGLNKHTDRAWFAYPLLKLHPPGITYYIQKQLSKLDTNPELFTLIVNTQQ